MELINQLAAPLAQSAQVARQQTSEKTQQIRRAQAARKNVAAQSDTFEHTVESTEEVTAIHDEQRQQPDPSPRRPRPAKPKRPPRDGDTTDPPPSIDVTA